MAQKHAHACGYGGGNIAALRYVLISCVVLFSDGLKSGNKHHKHHKHHKHYKYEETALLAALYFFLALLCAILLIYIGTVVNRRLRSQRGGGNRRDPFDNPASDVYRFGPDVIGPGAVISRGGIDYVVRGTVTITQGYYRWYEHLLQGNHGGEWLSVEYDEGQLILHWWSQQDYAQLDPYAGSVNYGGRTYFRKESGVADFTSEGETGLPAQGRVEYTDFADGEDLLGMERFGQGPWEVSVGAAISPGLLQIYPAPKRG